MAEDGKEIPVETISPTDEMPGRNSECRGAKPSDESTSKFESYCKLTALVIVLVALVYHLLRGSQEGSCTNLLTTGKWRENRGSEEWQPYGCMIHKYRLNEIQKCLRNRPLAIVGDSRLRDVYHLLVHELMDTTDYEKKKAHSNLAYTGQNNVSVKFFWMPEVNGSMLNLFEDWLKNSMERPSFVVVGASLWTIKNKDNAWREYKENFTRVKDAMNSLADVNDGVTKRMFTVKLKQKLMAKSPIIVWKLQEPVDESLLSAARKTITVEKINLYNRLAELFLFNTSVGIFKPSMLVKTIPLSSTTDGLHYVNEVVEWELTILLNRFCNAYIRPKDASCCMPKEHTTQLQYNSLAVFVACSLLFWSCPSIAHVVARISPIRTSKPKLPIKNPPVNGFGPKEHTPYKAMAKLTLIMSYFFICDSTLSMLYQQLCLRAESTEVILSCPTDVNCCTCHAHMVVLLNPFSLQISFLNRDQTDEWKGWAQLIILLYHYIGASKVLPFYVFVRLLVASYLFMSAYGNFTFFWKKGDFSLYRVCQVLVRMNMFVVILCLVMGRPYQFYYFVPLVTFWFLLLYVVLAVFPITAKLVQDDPRYIYWMLFKIALMFCGTCVMFRLPYVSHWIFSQWAIKELFVDQHNSVKEWIFRSRLDRYMLSYGVLIALLYQLSRSYGIVEDNNTKRLIQKPVSYLVIFICFMTLLGYSIQAYGCPGKVRCNSVHSVVSILPITAFILLRNISGFMRSHFSTFYAWVGKLSLELFVGQYHIWLANDTTGILVLVPNRPILNAIVTTFVFVCVCSEVNKTTAVLSDALVSKDVKVMMRRLIIFVIMLFIIWWHKTYHDTEIGTYQ
ncbi:LOW QUALITY PROTEIN: N-acetylneuraminate 9-O-acetyltransferase-like [Xenia sp. Carnegie-2017]|uniref:LOW QUALITY PROTEIN: N-acetylneuraminate 9-O-acetyltransferase-like n=1 Tax=Xenia sp. Carnegie-2017 TaxID=2897299 RepID=UPI001F04E7C3|nr:LOW QUALITY PROTEIN: N-acetylneuraminate 9-O-acetyltransferase-like [Xenia sp. Carnegie-2017]